MSHETYADDTLRTYERFADRYLESLQPMSQDMLSMLQMFAYSVGDAARVLEIGSGSGRDALLLESYGVTVQRSDTTSAFINKMLDEGYEVLRIDARDDVYPGGPYDGILANCSLLHLKEPQFRKALSTARAATADGGVLCLVMKKGFGGDWDTRLGGPRWMTYWQMVPLLNLLTLTGWDATAVTTSYRYVGDSGFLHVLAKAVERPEPERAFG